MRIRLIVTVVVALLAAVWVNPVARADTTGDEPVVLTLAFTQTEPVFDGEGNLVTRPGGTFTMSGDGAVCEGGAFYDEFIEDVAFPPGQLTVHDFKVFTCDDGVTFTLEFWVTFDLEPEFVLVESYWQVSESSIEGLTGHGTITERDWEREFPHEEWSGVFGVFDCKKGGWKSLTDHLGTPFKNQGDCVSYYATDFRNLAAG